MLLSNVGGDGCVRDGGALVLIGAYLRKLPPILLVHRGSRLKKSNSVGCALCSHSALPYPKTSDVVVSF